MNLKYRPEIDGLRALAVLPVILFHAGFTTFSGGFVGVDVFFVISGYLITSIIVKDVEAGTFSFWEFYERRARRILPALFLVMLCCIPFAWMWMMPADLKTFSNTLVSVIFFASNIRLWQQSGYFDTAGELKPLLHTWSLAVEEQFYIIFPIAILLMWRLGRRNVIWSIALVAVLSLALSEYASRYHPSFNFYWLPTRAWELMAGALCSFAVVRHNIPRDNFISLTGLVAITVSVFAYDETIPFPSLYALLPVLGTCAILLFARQGTLVASLLSLRPIVGIGLISYSAYLWHQPLFAFARIRAVAAPTWQLMLVLAAASIMLAYVSWRFVEIPARQRKSEPLRASRKVSVLLGVVAVILISAGLSGAFFIKQEVDIAADHFGLRGDRGGSQGNIVVVGDSHAGHLIPGLRYFFGNQVIEASSPGCIPFYGVDRYDDRFTPGDCERSMRTALDNFMNSKADQTIILSSMGPVYLDGTPFRGKDPARVKGLGVTLNNAPGMTDSWMIYEAGMRATIRKLIESGKKKVIFALDVPELGLSPVECAAFKSISILGTQFAYGLPSYNNCFVPRQEYDDRTQRYYQLVRRVLSDFPSVILFNPSNLFCDEKRCIGVQDGFPLYRDVDHLSAAGSLLVGRELAKLVD